LLNPAKYWADFKNLEIKIIPGYIHNELYSSSLPFKKSKDGSYIAKFVKLPNTDLTFELKESNINNIEIYIVLIILLILILFIILIRKRFKCINH
jgi:hypothetical protein